MSELRTTPFQRALHRPNLFMGGDRNLTLSSALISVALVINGQNLVAAIIGSVFWLCCLLVLRVMAQKDPQLAQVYVRQLRFSQRYYPPRSHPAAGLNQ